MCNSKVPNSNQDVSDVITTVEDQQLLDQIQPVENAVSALIADRLPTHIRNFRRVMRYLSQLPRRAILPGDCITDRASMFHHQERMQQQTLEVRLEVFRFFLEVARMHLHRYKYEEERRLRNTRRTRTRSE